MQVGIGGIRKKILIIGGVAGGASCAARARRLSEAAEIVLLDKGPHVSFANCGEPYYVGDVIKEEKSLILATPKLFRDRFNIEVRVNNEALSVDPVKKEVLVKNLLTGEEYKESYDDLVLSPGAKAIKPPIPGIDLEGVFSLRTIPDTNQVKAWIQKHAVKHATVVGGGFIGLEVTENLRGLGLAVTLVEGLKQVMAPLDPEMVTRVHDQIVEHKVELVLGDVVSSIEKNEGQSGLTIKTKNGKQFDTQMVIMGVGVRPLTDLAKSANVELGPKGGFKVDQYCRTSDPNIYAVGDAVETRDWITGEYNIVPLAGPANRMGRITADNILGRNSTFRGVQATAIVGVFGLTVASSGVNEKTLKRLNMRYEKVYMHPGQHAGYYPGQKPIDLKVLFDPQNGQLLGAQAVGEDGVDKRIDVLSVMIQARKTVFDMEEAELCYAPQYGSAKDIINMAGFIAANAIRGDAPIAHWEQGDYNKNYLLDVREVAEFERGHVPKAINIPLGLLRERMKELPSNQTILVYCQVGQRGYYATRALRLAGYDARNISGGYKSYSQFEHCLACAKL